MRSKRAWMNLLVCVAGLGFLVLGSAGCGKKPKYPACGGDKDCREGEYCINKQCLQCGDDSHCEPGQTCKNGGCVTKAAAKPPATDGLKPCKVDDDCEDDEDCLDNKCQKPWQSDTPDGVTCELEPIYFGYDDDSISEEARDSLGRTTDCVKQAPPDRGVYITGHTDSRGTEEYNIALSERRARSVADYIARLGVDPARFRVIPKGEAEATGIDEDSYQQDRRVDFEWR